MLTLSPSHTIARGRVTTGASPCPGCYHSSEQSSVLPVPHVASTMGLCGGEHCGYIRKCPCFPFHLDTVISNSARIKPKHQPSL